MSTYLIALSKHNFYLLFRLFSFLLAIYFLFENKKKSNLYFGEPNFGEKRKLNKITILII